MLYLLFSIDIYLFIYLSNVQLMILPLVIASLITGAASLNAKVSYTWSVFPSIYQSINLYTYLSMYLSIYLSIYLSNYLSIYLSIHLDERYDSSAYYRVLPGDLPALCPGGARPSHRHPPRQSGDQVPSGSRYISIC